MSLMCISHSVMHNSSDVNKDLGPKAFKDHPQGHTKDLMLFTEADRMYDRTAVVRPASQLRYDLFTERVASGNRIVGTIRLTSVLLASLMFIFRPKKCHSVGTKTLFLHTESK